MALNAAQATPSRYTLLLPIRTVDRIGSTSGSFFSHPEAWQYLAYQCAPRPLFTVLPRLCGPCHWEFTHALHCPIPP